MPGGFGTLDELFEALTLVQTQKVTRFPVVLFDRSYWSGLIDWLASTVLDRGAIKQTDLELFTVTDDVDEAVEVMRLGLDRGVHPGSSPLAEESGIADRPAPHRPE